MSLSTVRSALKTRLETISGLTVYAEVPDSIGKLPVAVIDLATADYDVAIGSGIVLWHFRVLLLLGEKDSTTAHTTLDGYMAKSGTTSVKGAVEGGAVGDSVNVRRAENVGHIAYRGNTYIGAEFIVDVVDSS